MWTHSANLKNLPKELVGTNPCTESGVKRNISAIIVESIKIQFRDAEQEKETVDPARNELELVSGQKMKGFWSAQLIWELHRVKRIRGEWEKIMNMDFGTKK